MAFKTGIANVAANTAIGTQEITCNESIGIPDAVMFIVTSAVTNGTVVDHAIMSVGFCDGANECITNHRGEDAAGPSDERRRSATDECIQCLNVADTNVDGEATGVGDGTGSNPGPITNGWRINWGAALGSAYRIVAVFFSGMDKAWVNTFAASPDVDGSVNVDCGPNPYFDPDLVIFISSATNFNDTTDSHGILHFGAAANVSGYPQCCMGLVAKNNKGTSETWGMTRNDRIIQNFFGATILGDVEIDFDDHADGFAAITRIAGGNVLGFLALKLTPTGAIKPWVGNLQSPTSTGNWAVTSPGFKPQLVIMGCNVVDTDDTAARHSGPTGIAVFNATDEACISTTNRDSSLPSDTSSHIDNNAVDLYKEDGSTQLFLGSYSSMDALGFTVNFTVADIIGAREWFGIAIPSFVPYPRPRGARAGMSELVGGRH